MRSCWLVASLLHDHSAFMPLLTRAYFCRTRSNNINIFCCRFAMSKRFYCQLREKQWWGGFFTRCIARSNCNERIFTSYCKRQWRSKNHEKKKASRSLVATIDASTLSTTDIRAIVVIVSTTIAVATTAAPPTERRIATVANARHAMGIALATISLESGSPRLAAKKTAMSVPWYVVSQEAMTTKVDCNEGCKIAPRNNQQNIFHCIARTRATSRHWDTQPLIARKTMMIISFMSCCKRSNDNNIFDVASSGCIAREPTTTVIQPSRDARTQQSNFYMLSIKWWRPRAYRKEQQRRTMVVWEREIAPNNKKQTSTLCCISKRRRLHFLHCITRVSKDNKNPNIRSQ